MSSNERMNGDTLGAPPPLRGRSDRVAVREGGKQSPAHRPVVRFQRTRAKALRSEMTDAEQRLWSALRGHRLSGLSFRRQTPIGRFIVDFVCHERYLIIEVDIQCRKTKDEVRFGEGEDWMEILGCGMVHPNVLRNCGLDPDVYQGFAWGMGIDRLAMLKYGIADLRQMFESDVRWLDHYGFKPLDIPTLAGGLST